MSATTIKLEGKILKDLSEIKPLHQSLTSFIREILQRDLERRKLQEAGTKYVQFLASHQNESDEMEAWENADLASSPKEKFK